MDSQSTGCIHQKILLLPLIIDERLYGYY